MGGFGLLEAFNQLLLGDAWEDIESIAKSSGVT